MKIAKFMTCVDILLRKPIDEKVMQLYRKFETLTRTIVFVRFRRAANVVWTSEYRKFNGRQFI